MTETVPPPGYQPLFLATASCEIFNLKPGVDVTAEEPMKLLSKASLLSDIDNRRAVSDFQPYKAIISVHSNRYASFTHLPDLVLSKRRNVDIS